jgi:hypothetical protein
MGTQKFGCGREVSLYCDACKHIYDGEAEWWSELEFQCKGWCASGLGAQPIAVHHCEKSVLEALPRKFRGGLPMELLYADDLVLLADSEGLLVEKIQMWKAGMGDKGLRVNMGKTTVMRCRGGASPMVKSGKYPCGISGTGVGSNSILCTSCHAWIHKRCSGITQTLMQVDNYQCRRCTEGSAVESGVLQQVSLESGQNLERVGKFCYLGYVKAAGVELRRHL